MLSYLIKTGLLSRSVFLITSFVCSQLCYGASEASLVNNNFDEICILAADGDFDANIWLARAYRYGEQGVEIDYDKALKHYMAVSILHPYHATSRVEIFQMYQADVVGMDAIRKQAELALLKEAEANQNAHAYYTLFLINWDKPELRRVYQFKAADLGHSVAAYMAGHHYQYGWSVDKDLFQAISFYEIAAKNDHTYSMDILKELSTDPRVLKHFSEEDISRISNYFKLYKASAEQAAVEDLALAKAAFEQGDEAQADAFLDAGVQRWRARTPVANTYHYKSRIWWEGQTQTGRSELEWSRYLYSWLCKNYDADEKMTYNRIGAAGHLAERHASLGHLGLLREVCGKLQEHMLAQDGIDVGLYLEKATLQEDYTFTSGTTFPVYAEVDKITHRRELVRKNDLICANTMSAMEYLAQDRLAVGDWESALFYANWMEQWIKHIERTHETPERVFPGYHAVVHEDGLFAKANIFEVLGLFEHQIQAYQMIIDEEYQSYKSRGYQRATYKLADVLLRQGRVNELDLVALEENEEKVKANKFVESHEWQFSKLIRAKALSEIRGYSEGVSLVDEVLTFTAENDLPFLRLEALLVASEIAMNEDKYEHVEDLLVEALSWSRGQGLLLEELRIYRLYVRYLIAVGDYERALEMQLRIIERLDALNLKPRRESALLQLAKIYTLLGDIDSGWLVIDELSDSRLFKDWLTTVSLPQQQQSVGSSAPLVEQVGLQPIGIVSAPVRTEGRVIFTLSNPAQVEQHVELVLTAPHFELNSVSSVEDYIAYDLRFVEDEMLRSKVSEYTISRGSQVPVIISASGLDELRQDFHIELSVKATERSLSSRWDIESSATEAAVSIVDAARLMENPFYTVPVYHHLSGAGTKAFSMAIRAQASVPTRIEAYHTNGELIFVDAEGNGSLADPGDIIGALNLFELYPVLEWQGEDLPIEFRYHPLGKVPTSRVEIQIETHSQNADADWEVNVIDWLETSKD